MTVIESPPGAGATSIIVAPYYAYGVVRVSDESGRSGSQGRRQTRRIPHVRSAGRSKRQSKVDTFRSPDVQKERVNSAVRGMWIEGPDGLSHPVEVAKILDEIDVSGRRPLARRKGLLEAVLAVEAGYVKVVIVAYFDRLMRDVDVKREVVRRVEAAGGMIFAMDFGKVSHATAMQRLTSDMMAAWAEYQSRATEERISGMQAAAIEEGLPIGAIAPGYRQNPDTFRLEKYEPEATVMHNAFKMRADGASWEKVRTFMREGGIERGSRSVRDLLHSRTYLGELFHGKHRKVGDHEAIIDEATFDRVQRQKGKKAFAPPGRKSSLLMAGLRILKCGSCQRTLAVGIQQKRSKTYPMYRCNPQLAPDCPKRVQILAHLVDDEIAAYVQARLARANLEETQGVGWQLLQARTDAEAADEERDTVVGNLARVKGAAAKKMLDEAQARSDAAHDLVAELERRARVLGDTVAAAGKDWNDPETTLEDRREMVAAVLARVVVEPGRPGRPAGGVAPSRLQLIDVGEG